MIAEYLNTPKTVVLRVLKRGLGKEKVVCRFCSTLLDTWSNHILRRYYRDGWCRQKLLLTKLLQDMRPGILPLTTKQRENCSEWFARKSPRPKKLTFQRSRIKNMLIIFSTLKN